jgi:predicted PurR-regulated permease PerM
MKGVPRTGAFILTCLAILLFIGGVGLLFIASLSQFVNTMPQYTAQIQASLDQVKSALSAAGFSKPSTPDTSTILSAVKGLASWLASGVYAFGIALLFAAFLLADAHNFPSRLASVSPIENTERTNKFAAGIRTWAGITTMTNLLVAVGNTVILSLLHVPFALLWGILSFFLGYIPSIGFMISLIPPAIMGYLNSGLTTAILVIVAYILVNGGVQNILMPRWMGDGLNLSPFVVIFSLFFWGLILGPLGAILAVPLTQVLRLAMDSSPETAYIGVLIGAGKGEAVTTE